MILYDKFFHFFCNSEGNVYATRQAMVVVYQKLRKHHLDFRRHKVHFSALAVMAVPEAGAISVFLLYFHSRISLLLHSINDFSKLI